GEYYRVASIAADASITGDRRPDAIAHFPSGSLARDPAEKRLQIARSLDRRLHRVIVRLTAAVDRLREAAGGAGGRLDQSQQLVGAQMIGARAAPQQRIAFQQAHRALVELAVSR